MNYQRRDILAIGVTDLNKKLLEKLQPNARVTIVVLLLCGIITYFFGHEISRYIAIGEFVFVLFFALYMPLSMRKRSAKLIKYIETVTSNSETASKDAFLNCPLPVVIFSPQTQEILWSNGRFVAATGAKERFFEVRMSDIVPGFAGKWLLEGKTESTDLYTLGDRRYKVFGSLMRSSGDPDNIMAAAYFVDVTEYAETFDEFVSSRLMCAIIMLDNYDELIKNLSEKEKSAILSAVDDKISDWIIGCDGILSKYDRDRYMFLFEGRHLKNFVDGKFDVLDGVRESIKAGGVQATLSIGIGRDGKTFDETYRFASLAIEMALSRGGDQAVVKNRFNFEFYGGHSAEVERRTKVKSRVMANAFGELIGGASEIIIMGHKHADLDSLGAAVGVCCIARKRGKPAHIVTDLTSTVAGDLVGQLRQTPEYEDIFITAQEAMISADSRTLLVIVDTNRPEQVESLELLESVNHVAVIDHHRRAAQYIENATLNFHEPYASSAAELVSEMMQYLVDQTDILRIEAEALLAGIVLDTKSFSIRTGSRTFEAASFLRRCGADTTEVKRLLQSDFETTMEKFAIIQGARIYKPGIAIAFSEVSESRVIVAKAADELLNIAGIQASFVISPEGEDVFVSARSIGNINVQVIMEALGGGGNQSTAGAQIAETTVSRVSEQLTAAIDTYLAGFAQNT